MKLFGQVVRTVVNTVLIPVAVAKDVLTLGSVPRAGEFVNIRKVTFLVEGVTWAVDNADDVMGSKLRANVELKRV